MRKILKGYLDIWLFLLPILFFPLVVDGYGFGKNWLMFFGILLGLIIWAVSLVVDKENKVVITKAWWWLLALTLWASIFWFLTEAGVKSRTFMSFPGLGALISLLGWSFLWLQVKDNESLKNREKLLVVSTLIVAISSLVTFLIPSSKLPISWPKQNPIINLTQGWSLSGSMLSEFWLLLILAYLWTRKVFEKIKNREDYFGQLVVTAVLVLVLFLDIYKIAKSGWNYLDFNSSWIITAESLKNKTFQGVGIGNFVEAFNWWRPGTFNSSANWSGVFSWAANGMFQIWTEMGIVGLVLALLIWKNLWKDQKNRDGKILIFVLGTAAFLTPVNYLLWMLIIWLAMTEIKEKEIKMILKVGESGVNGAPVVLLLVIILGVGGISYGGARTLMGEVYLKNSLVAASSNDGGSTYNWLIKAIGANGNNADYRQLYSQTNLALATSLLNTKDISDEQKEKAATLVQQAIREGKAAVSLDSQNAAYWSNLATLYRQLVGSVDGAADWSSQAYNQAVALDPMNPNLRLSYGGLLYALGDYESADRLFEQTVSLKSDLANGWYNWAYTAKSMNKLAEAVSRLSQAVSLVPVTSGDYESASKELDVWKKEYEATVKKQQESSQNQLTTGKTAETLKTPEVLPTGNSSKIDIPTDGLEAPTGELSPSPTQ